MALTKEELQRLTDQIIRSLEGKVDVSHLGGVPAAAGPAGGTGRWLCDTAEEAVANAKAAQARLMEMTLDQRAELIAAMRKAGMTWDQVAELQVQEDNDFPYWDMMPVNYEDWYLPQL